MAEFTIGRAGLAPGLNGWIAAEQLGQNRQAQEVGMLAKILEMRQQQEEAAAKAELRPLQMENIRSEIAARNAQATERVSKAQQEALQRQAGMAFLIAQTPQGSYNGPVQPGVPTSVNSSEEEALAKLGARRMPDGSVQRIPGLEGLGSSEGEAGFLGNQAANVPNQSNLRSLFAIAHPDEFARQQAAAMFPKPQTITRGTVKDTNSPTGWSHADVISGRILATGAPPPASANSPQGSTVSSNEGLFYNVGGRLTPLTSPTSGEQLRAPSADNASANRAITLRRTYDSHPEVKFANSLEVRVSPMADYIIKISTPDKTTGVKESPNPVSDSELAKLFIMTTHPKGDQISNLDLREMAKLADLPGRISVAVGGLFNGKTLDDDVRRDMWKSITEKYKSVSRIRTAQMEDTINRGRNMGVDRELLFPTDKK